MIDIQKIVNAAKMIKGKVIRTPLVHSPSFSRMFGCEIYLKLENLQKTGSFKIRGALNSIMANRTQIGPNGVVAASAGNHAQGVALAARHAGILSTIVMPEWASISKQEATRSYGGRVIISGQSLGESLETAEAMKKENMTLIHPFDDPDIISGQGTIALEIIEDLKNPDIIVVPVGGGGLISGIAGAVKTISPPSRVVGVQAKACPSVYEASRRGKIINVDAQRSIADGISVKQVGKLNFEIIKKYIDDVVLVEEEMIAAAVLLLLERKKTLAEGAGAVPLAALLSGALTFPKGSKVVLVISGGNLDSPLLGRIISKGLVKNGRIMRFGVRLDDSPGSLVRLLTLIAELKANVLHIYHHRNVENLPVYVTGVDLELETRGPVHVDEIIRSLGQAGYELKLTVS